MTDRSLTPRSSALRLLAFIPVLALLTVSASAGCHVIGHKNGEDICETTSDGGGSPYVVSPTRTKTIGDIQVTTYAPHSSGSRVLMRNPDVVRRLHNWH
jgi:hypothetical protein